MGSPYCTAQTAPSCAPLLGSALIFSGQYAARCDSGAGVWHPHFSRESSALADSSGVELLGRDPSAKQHSKEWKDPESNRPYFRQLRNLFDTIAASQPEHADMRILSMGMTGDYEVAVEEGSTLVRVGTGIFGARDYGQQQENH